MREADPHGDKCVNTYTRQAARQQKEAASKASRSDRPSHGSPFPISMREEGTGSRKRDRSLSSNRAAESAHRHKRHSGQDPNVDPEQSGTDDSAASRKGKAKKSTLSSGPKTSGGGSGFPRRDPDSSAVSIDSQFPGNSTVPESAMAVETVDGRVAGTPEEPILKYEDCLTLTKVGKPATKFWTIDMLGVEKEGLKDTKKPIATVTSPARETLPRLPVWGSPNGWDYWGRPWVYMDAPHNCPDLKVMSVHEPLAARVTVAVLVNCEREPQYFPNLDMAKSAAAASTWRGKKGKVVDGNGNYLGSDKSPTQAARQVLPRFFGNSNPAVEAIFKGWDAYHSSKVMWRPNPAMPEGDVTPDGCIRARPAERLSNTGLSL